MANGQTKVVDIQIADEDLETLKKSGYQLCFAKKVNDSYNVVWQSASDYLSENTFSWQPLYELFGSNTFAGDVTVNVSTNPVSIGLGDQATLDASGVLGEASSGGPATGITMINNYGSIHPGLSAYAIDISGNAETTPVYVAANPIVSGQDVLTPVETVQVWFEQNIATSTMFSTARSNAVEIDLTEQNQATRLYRGGAWLTPPADVRFVNPRTILTIGATLTAAVVVQDIASKIASKLTGVYKDVTVDVTTPGGTVVKVEYHEKPGLSETRQRLTDTLLQNPPTVDVLTGFALDAFAVLGLGFVLLNATTTT